MDEFNQVVGCFQVVLSDVQTGELVSPSYFLLVVAELVAHELHANVLSSHGHTYFVFVNTVVTDTSGPSHPLQDCAKELPSSRATDSKRTDTIIMASKEWTMNTSPMNYRLTSSEHG